MEVEKISLLLRSAANSVWACREPGESVAASYTLLAVEDRETAKTVIALFEEAFAEKHRSPFLNSFVEDGKMCYLFPYRTERKLSEFMKGQVRAPAMREEICVGLVLACLDSPFPAPLLYLQLKQGQIGLSQDNGVYLTPAIDLAELDPRITEEDCVRLCAQILIGILRTNARKELKSFELIRRKTDHLAYQQFSEVYHDIRMTMTQKKKRLGIEAVKRFFAQYRDVLFRILLVFCIVTAAIAAIMLISYLAVGDFAFFRLFTHNLNTIGTERLNV
ncbi:MAG: hypothetical protein LBR44_10780 [Clostridiales Family XIII bacterium]|nr:hypothetical protein [Clostridiales Family XIII bacterium]